MTREEIIYQLDGIVGTYEILIGHGVNSDILDVDDIEAIREAIKVLEQEPEWHDSENPPKEDGYILLSFSNFSIPLVGRYEGNEEDGGNYYIGDDDTSALSQDIYVNGWMELPKCRED